MSGFVNSDNLALDTDTSNVTIPNDGETVDKEKSKENGAQTVTLEEIESLRKQLRDKDSYRDKLLNEKKTEIEELRKELQNKSLPSSEEALAKFAEENPESYSLIERMIEKKAMESQNVLGQRLREVEAKADEINYKQGIAKLLELHPDAESIRTSPEFQEWYPTQPNYVINILTSNDASIDDLSFVLNKYKSEKGLVETPETKKKQKQKEGAEAVTTSDKPNPTDGSKTKITESWIKSLSPDEFQKHLSVIIEAQKKGEIVHDITGQ